METSVIFQLPLNIVQFKEFINLYTLEKLAKEAELEMKYVGKRLPQPIDELRAFIIRNRSLNTQKSNTTTQ